MQPVVLHFAGLKQAGGRLVKLLLAVLVLLRLVLNTNFEE